MSDIKRKLETEYESLSLAHKNLSKIYAKMYRAGTLYSTEEGDKLIIKMNLISANKKVLRKLISRIA
jgi:hypothetical protein